MLAAVREHRGRVHYLVVYAVNRFAREQFDHYAVRAHLHKLGITLRSVTEPIDESSTGRLMEGILRASPSSTTTSGANAPPPEWYKPYATANGPSSPRSDTSRRSPTARGRWRSTRSAPRSSRRPFTPSRVERTPRPRTRRRCTPGSQRSGGCGSRVRRSRGSSRTRSTAAASSSLRGGT